MSEIIIVDDLAANRMIMRLILEHRGHRVVESATVDDFFRALRETAAPDVAIFDLHLGEDSGTAMLRRLRADAVFGKLPVLFASAQPERAAVIDAAGLGILGFLSKPIDSARLLQAVAAGIEGHWMRSWFGDIDELCVEHGMDRASYLSTARWLFGELAKAASRSAGATTPAALRLAAGNLGFRGLLPALEQWERDGDLQRVPELLQRHREVERLFEAFAAGSS